MKRTIMLIIGWLAVMGALFYFVLMLDFHWNFFDWLPELDLETAAYILGIFVAVAAVWFLGRVSRDKISRVVAALACLALALLAIFWYPAEPTSHGLFGRIQPSPFWFRGGRVLLLCVPAVILFFWTRRHLAQQSGPVKGSQPFRSE